MTLAKTYDGEIICADSRTIYRGMDIGTAKPTASDQAAVAHHLLDIIEPGEAYSAAQFKVEAERAIADISERRRLPVVVGGTGLYVNALLYDYQFPAGARDEVRFALEQLPLEQLVERLRLEDPEMAAQIDLQNPRRVIRAIETIGQPRHKTVQLNSNILLVGLRPPEEQLNKQIIHRTQAMFQVGLIDEGRHLFSKYGTDLEAFRSPGYAEIIDYLAGRTSRQQAEELINLHTRQLLRRQLTWFKRNPDIKWCETPAQAEALVAVWLKDRYT